MLTLLITGSRGQLGSEIRNLEKEYPHYRFLFTDIEELDITDQDEVMAYIKDHNADVVINCAAYTAVDKAEDEPDTAMLINRDAVGNLAKACKENNSFLVHVSTDYVFRGDSFIPYKENDPVKPVTSYGTSKLAGEELMRKYLDKGMIIRTSWLYSTQGSNFVKKIIERCAEMSQLKIVNDQTGCPTYARDLAVAILEILPKAISARQLEIYHYSNEGECTWYEFAKTTLELAHFPCQAIPVSSDEFPQKAPRPKYSVMDKTKIKEHFNLSIPDWKDSLADMIENSNI